MTFSYFPFFLLGLTFVASSCVPAPRIEITEQNDLPPLKVKTKRTNYSSKVRLKTLAARVRNNHPQLRAAKLKIAELEGHLLQAGRLENPRLGIGLSKSALNLDTDLGVSFSQSFPVTNKLLLEKRVKRQSINIAKKEIEAVSNRFIGEAQLIAVQILHLRQQKGHFQQQIASLTEINDFIEAAAARGELSGLDAAQTKLKTQSLRIQQKKLKHKEQQLISQLKPYLGLPPRKPLSLTGSLPAIRLPKIKASSWQRPDYQAKALKIKQSKSAILWEKSKRFEDVEMEITGGLGIEEDSPESSIGVGINIPLPWYNRNEGNIQAEIARNKRLQLEKVALSKNILGNAANHKETMQLWMKQNAAIRNTLLPMAEDNSFDLEKAYLAGQSDFTSWLKSRSDELELRTQLYSNNLEFQLARVRYFSAIGQPQKAF